MWRIRTPAGIPSHFDDARLSLFTGIAPSTPTRAIDFGGPIYAQVGSTGLPPPHRPLPEAQGAAMAFMASAISPGVDMIFMKVPMVRSGKDRAIRYFPCSMTTRSFSTSSS